jgi:hypothetical protein
MKTHVYIYMPKHSSALAWLGLRDMTKIMVKRTAHTHLYMHRNSTTLFIYRRAHIVHAYLYENACIPIHAKTFKRIGTVGPERHAHDYGQENSTYTLVYAQK